MYVYSTIHTYINNVYTISSCLLGGSDGVLPARMPIREQVLGATWMLHHDVIFDLEAKKCAPASNWRGMALLAS